MFPFPSNGKAYPKVIAPDIEIRQPEFPFPSNGKAYPKLRNQTTLTATKGVSIPFKRESISKVYIIGLMQRKDNVFEFPFPSNGKAYPKYFQKIHNLRKPNVSIPFKRESISKVLTCEKTYLAATFPFPSNGKAYPK